MTESFPAPLADLINDLRQNFHILYLPSPQSLPPYFPEHQKKAREDAIKAHADQVTDTLDALNQSSSSIILAFDYALGREDWPKGKDIQPSIDRLPRTQKTETTTHSQALQECESQALKRKREDEDDSSNKWNQSMAARI